MSEPSLEGCQAKLDRAREHLQTLYDEINTFTHPDPHEIVREHDPESRTDEVFIKILREPDDLRWGVLLGDFLHNLRCALDHLVWQLVILDQGKPGRHNQFPIAMSGPAYWVPPKTGGPCMRDRMLKGVSNEHRTLIDGVQPYRRGHDAPSSRLAILSDFSNTDKHQIVHPTLVVIQEPDLDRDFDAEAFGSEGFAEIEFTHSGPVEDGAKIMSVRYVTDDPDARVKMKANVTVGIGFGHRGLRPEVLGELMTEVRDVLAAFAPEFV